jgi:hypothetical protein
VKGWEEWLGGRGGVVEKGENSEENDWGGVVKKKDTISLM